MLGFNVINLIVPDEPGSFDVNGSIGTWNFKKFDNYDENVKVLSSGVHAVMTYIADHPDLGSTHDDTMFEEIAHLCLLSSFLSSNTVTINSTTVYSRFTIMQVGDGFPREKGLSGFQSICQNKDEFKDNLELMLASFSTVETDWHIELIIHYWLDSLSCWSLENLYLSACTILEVIKQGEIRRTGSNLHFYDAIESVSNHFGITVLNRDWIKMRNDLIHEGHLSKARFAGKSKQECIEVCEDVMNWLDEFVFAAFNIGALPAQRFGRGSLGNINSYSTW